MREVPPTSGNQQVNPQAAQTVKLNELVVVPPKFDGNRVKARRWLDDYERAGMSKNWNEATKAKYFQAYLTDSASDWFAVVVQTDVNAAPIWSEVCDKIERFYVGKDEDLALKSRSKTIQQANEGAAAFIARYARLMRLTDDSVTDNLGK